MSLIVVAERIVFEKKEAINIYDLFDLVATEKGLSNPEKAAYISQFYSDLTTSAKFSYVGENKWDLKENHKLILQILKSNLKDYQFLQIGEDNNNLDIHFKKM